MRIKTANGGRTLFLTKKEWLAIGKKAGWSRDGKKVKGLRENARFYDPRTDEEGTLVTRAHHGTTLWMMLYDSGEIQELTVSDLKRIENI